MLNVDLPINEPTSIIFLGLKNKTTEKSCHAVVEDIEPVLYELWLLRLSKLSIFLKNSDCIVLLFIKELSRIISDVTCWMKDVSGFAQQISDGLGSMRVASEIIDRK